MKRKAFLIYLATGFGMSMSAISCAAKPFDNGFAYVDLDAYFKNTEYEYVSQINELEGWLTAFDIPYFEEKIDWGVFKTFQQEKVYNYEHHISSYQKQMMNAQVKNRTTGQKYQWFATYNPPWNSKVEIQHFYSVNHFWWDYFPLFEEQTGYVLFDYQLKETEYFRGTHPSSAHIFVDNNDVKINFLSYDAINDIGYSFIASLGAEELVLNNEFETLKPGETIINQPGLDLCKMRYQYYLDDLNKN